MKVALFYSESKVRIAGEYLYAEYPTSQKNKVLIADKKKFPWGERGYFFEAVEISQDLNSLLRAPIFRNTYLENSEVIGLYNRYTMIAKQKTGKIVQEVQGTLTETL